jgi:hypothetical protein
LTAIVHKTWSHSFLKKILQIKFLKCMIQIKKNT